MRECISYNGSIFYVYNITLELTLGDIYASLVFLKEPYLAIIFYKILNSLLFVKVELRICYSYLNIDYIVIDKKIKKDKIRKVKLILASKTSTTSINTQVLGYLIK